MSYSQYDEEKYILEACRDATMRPGSGRFLEIGAWHPTDKSNVRALYELGWSGLSIEPSPGPLLNLLNEYAEEPRITIIAAAVALAPGFIELHVTDDAVSTADRKQYETWKEVTKFRGTLWVPAITLPQISNQFGGFDFINIDAEGTSVDLFLEALGLGWEPQCWCVEHDNRLGELQTKATGKGYVVTMTNSTNVVLVRK